MMGVFNRYGCSYARAIVCSTILLYLLLSCRSWTLEKTETSFVANSNSEHTPHLKNVGDFSSPRNNIKLNQEKSSTSLPHKIPLRNVNHPESKKTVHTIPSLTDGKGTAKRLPECIIVGVPKSGTFTLIRFLGQHPNISIPQKEVNFFSKDENYSLGYQWYLDQLPYSQPGQITIEKSPRYFYYDYVPSRIWAMNKHVKLLVLLRNPIKRVVSCYVQRVAEYEEKQQSYNKSLEDVIINPRTSQIHLGENCVDETLYAKHFQRWFKQFPREQIHVIDGDMLITDPYSEIHKVEEYLNLPTWFTPDMFHFNDDKGFYCFVKPGNAHEYCMPESKGRDHPEMSRELEQKLIKFLEPHSVLLSEILGRNLSWYDQ